MSTNEVDAPARHVPVRGRIRDFSDRWPFRRKLNLLVAVPLAVIALLLVYVVADLVRQSISADSAAQLVRDSTQVARLVDKVEAEHQQAILLSARYESGYATPSTAAYRAARDAVDSQVRTVRDTFGDRLPGTEADALRQVEGLSSLRDSVEASYLPADNIDPAYGSAANDLIDGLGLDRNASLATTFTGSLVDSLLRADAAHAAFETNVFAATTRDTNALIEFTNAVGAYDLYQQQDGRFARFATTEQAAQLTTVEHTKAQSTIAQSYAELQINPGKLEAGSQNAIRAAVKDALTGYPAYRDQAAARLNITTSLIGQIADRADATASTARWHAIVLVDASVLGFVLWIAVAALVRRSVIRPVQALTGVAHEVAEVAGRELARVADDDAEDDGPPLLRDIPVTARDEIGDLAEAFNQVQTTAAALLARQVLSRRNTAEMFGNVGRRVSNLTTRQLAFIDAVERAETDPALLERLYSIDHIAVRLRRNADSLMLLAGIRETVLASGPTPVSNVVRAALGQIEGYQRVRLYAGTDAMIEPDIIGDLTLMVAELLENAVSFSPAGSPVEVTVRSSDEGAHIVVTDHGLGMSAERLAEENARLIRRERLDLVPTRVLGLFVVGALARRWEIGIELTRTPGGGVTAEVTLPSRLLLTMSAVGDTAGTPVAVEPTAPAEPSGPVPTESRAEPDAALPRRVPSREPAAEAGTAPLIPAARSGEPPADPADGPRPLRRRVRGATLRTTVGAAQALSRAPHTRDAEAERDALEEFEAAVERARRESDTGSFERPTPTAPESHQPTVRRDPGDFERPTPAGLGDFEQTAPRDPESHQPTVRRIDPLNPPQDQNHLPEGAEQ